MKETEKNYEERIKNGDFKNYLHGKGIDVGGGDDCLKLPPEIQGTVKLWDVFDGDAQYLHKLQDNSFDFVYSSHCLEHMRDINTALMNWIRVCKEGGILYICVPHEAYYEKGIWPSVNNKDHKHSFTVNEKSNMPANVVVTEFLSRFAQWIDVIAIRENLMNYHFDWPKNIDQTAVTDENICAQIDIIMQKVKNGSSEGELSSEWRKQNTINWLKDYWSIMFLIQVKQVIWNMTPQPILTMLRYIKRRFKGRSK